MPRRAPRAPHLILLLIAGLALTGCGSANPSATHTSAPPKHSAKPLVSAQLQVAEHFVTQEGLAIALASNVLQAQLQLVSDASDDAPPVACTPLTGGGAKKVTSESGTSDARTLTDVTYYDTACTHPYLTAQATTNQSGDTAHVTASVSYTGVAGAALGVLATTAQATFAESGLVLEGTGTFTRKGAGPVSLGLACQTASDTVLNCQGGVSQDFPALHHSIGSITPLSLTVGDDVSDPITFQGSGNTTALGTLGALSVTSADGVHLALGGAATTTGTSTTTGQAGGFVLFPPTPTGWTITDTANDVSFTISVVDNTTRALTGTIDQVSSKRQLAAFSVDQSGTGTITYLGQKPAAITSWTLTK